MSVYTKTGDKGETGLFSSDRKKIIRVSKDSLRIETIGTIDELNSFLGIVISLIKDKNTLKTLVGIQNNLFTIGSILAGANLEFSDLEVKKLEKHIDVWEKDLPVLKNFILPGGSEAGSFLFYVRTLARRAERNVVALSKKENVKEGLLKYLNRLSDYLFVCARYVNNKKHIKEIVWKV